MANEQTSAFKGIVLAGGSGTRLYPMTGATSKQLLPVYDKPMVYYPLATLMLAGVREILLISSPRDLPRFKELLGNGSQWGLRLSYAEQAEPKGIAQALIIAEEFLAGSPSLLILGDNMIYGHGLSDLLRSLQPQGCAVFGHRVKDPNRYGVVELDAAGRALSIEEKPVAPRSDMAIIGLYAFDRHAPAIAGSLRPSVRGELEITDVVKDYLLRDRLKVEVLGPGFAWFDAGTPDSLLETSEFVRTLQHRQNVTIACLEEIAFSQGWIDRDQLRGLAAPMGNGDYAARVRGLLSHQR